MGPEKLSGPNRRFALPSLLAVLALVAALCAPGAASAEPAAGPTLTVTPSTGLHHGSVVTVTGSGFKPGAPLFLMETIRVPIVNNLPVIHNGKKKVTADRAGKFTTKLKVLQRFAHINCVVTGCFVSTVSANVPSTLVDRSQDATAPIAFGEGTNGYDDDILPHQRVVRPELTVDPARGLQEGNEVTVTGKNFPANTQLNVAQTLVRPENGRPTEHSDPVQVTTDATGNFTTTLEVSHKVKGNNCLRVACFVAAYPTVEPAPQGEQERPIRGLERQIVEGHDAWTELEFDGSDLTTLALDAEQIQQAETGRINISGAQPHDLFRIEVLGPGDFSAQPWIMADEHGNASLLMMSDFAQETGSYTVRLTTDRTGAVTETKFSVSTNAFFDPAQHEGRFQEIENTMPAAGPSHADQLAQAEAEKRRAWNSWWYIVGAIAAVVGFGIIGWFARDRRRPAQGQNLSGQ